MYTYMSFDGCIYWAGRFLSFIVLCILQMRYVFQTLNENNTKIKVLEQSDLHFLLSHYSLCMEDWLFFFLFPFFVFPLVFVFCSVSPRSWCTLLFFHKMLRYYYRTLLVNMSIKLLGQTILETRHWNSHSFYVREIPILCPDHNSNYLA